MRILVFLFLLLVSKHTMAVNISSIELPYRLTTNPKSPYQLILNKFFSEIKSNSELNISPIRRSIKNFFQKKQLCLMPTSRLAMIFFYPKKMKKYKVIQSAPIENVIVTIFSKAGSPPISDIKDINGKTISTWNGIFTDKLMPNAKVEVIKVSKDKQSLSLLKAGRVDHVIGFIPDTLLVAENNGFAIPSFNKKVKLLETPVHLICHETEETKKFLSQFNLFLKRIKNSGSLKQILGKYSVVSP